MRGTRIFSLIGIIGTSLLAAPGEWAYPRHDRANTGHQPLSARIQTPRILSRLYIGGHVMDSLSVDLMGDENPEFLSIQGGDLIASSSALIPLWKRSFLQVQRILKVIDLNNDGRPEILALGLRCLWILSAEGDVLWSQKFEGSLDPGRVQVSSPTPHHPAPQIAVWPDRSLVGTVFSYAPQKKTWMELYQTESLTEWERNYPPEILWADMNRDGILDLVIATYGRVLTFNGQDGTRNFDHWNSEVKWISGPDINGRNYGTLIAKDLDQDGYPEVILLADSVCLHLAVLKNSPSGLSLQYDHFLAYAYASTGQSLQTTLHSVEDFDGDGHFEILWSFFDASSDPSQGWQLHLTDALSGNPKQKGQRESTYLIGAQDLDGDGRWEIFTSETPKSQNLQILSYSTEKGFQSIWNHPKIELALNPFVRNVSQYSSVSRHGYRGVHTLEGKFFIQDDLGWHSVQKKKHRWKVSALTHESGHILTTQSKGSTRFKQVRLFLENKSGEILEIENQHLLARVRAGGFNGIPIVADLDGDGLKTLLTASYGRIQSYIYKSEGWKLRWRQEGFGLKAPSNARLNAPALRLEPASSLIAEDLDSSPGKEIPIVQNTSEHSVLSLLSARGKVLHRIPLDLPPVDAETGVYSWIPITFRNPQKVDLWVSGLRGGWNSESSRIVDLQEEKIIATLEEEKGRGFGPFAGYSAVQRNAQGLDTLYCLLKDRLMQISQWPLTITHLGDINGLYHTPTLLEDHNSSRLIMSAGYSQYSSWSTQGQRLWEQNTAPWDLYGRQSAFGDSNGDDSFEMGISHSNGLFEIIDSRSGVTQQKILFPRPSYDMASVDIDGNGKDDFIMASSDGLLRAVGEQGVLWEFPLEVPLGDLIVADVLNRGDAQILVMAADGYLYIVGEAHPPLSR